MRKYLWLALVLAFAAVAPGWASTAGQITAGGVERSYLLHVPAKLPAHPALIIALHGGGGTAEGMEKLTGFDALADAQGFITVYPQAIDRRWNDGRSTIKIKSDDVGFIAALVARLEAQYGIDPNRIYATGMSNGAIFANFLGCRLAGQLAAIAPVSGSLAADLTPPCAPARPISVLLIAGTADPIVPFNGGSVRNFHGRGVGGVVTGAPATADFWAQADGCGAFSPASFPPPLRADDPTRLEEKTTATCRNGTNVTLISVQGAGHVWPGGAQYLPRFIIGPGSWQMNASAEITAFFLAHPAR
jgi:polyhydroxybutyrate depolymerase